MRKVDISSVGDLPKKVKSRDTYPDEVKEKVLAEVMLTNDPYNTALKANIPYKTVRTWVKESIKAPIVNEVRRKECETFAKAAWKVIAKALKEVDKKIDKATAKEAAWIVGVLADKALRASVSVTLTKETSSSSLGGLENLPDEFLDALVDMMRKRKVKEVIEAKGAVQGGDVDEKQ